MRPLISVVTPVHIKLKEELDYLRELVLSFAKTSVTVRPVLTHLGLRHSLQPCNSTRRA